MNSTLQALYDRKSVRVFEDTPVSDEVAAQIIAAAMQAPTAGNQQLYTIINVKNAELKQKLAVSCDNQPFIAKAPLVLVFVADCVRWRDAYGAAGLEPRAAGAGDMLLAVIDTAIAAQNSVVAAHALGLGSCYVGDILEQKETHTELLGLQPGLVPVALVVYGTPTVQQRARPKPPRFAVADITFTDRYRRQDEAELRRIFTAREGDDFDFDKAMAAFGRRKYESDFSIEMTRSVAEYIKEYAPFAEKMI